MYRTFSNLVRLTALSVFLAVTSVASLCYAQRPTHDGKVLLFGNLHAHSQLSDDVQSTGDAMSPLKAFQYAHQHGLDFLAISDHHKATDSSNRLWMTQSEYKSQLFDIAVKYNADHPGLFIAIPGIEWGTTKTGNHINAFGIRSLPPDTIKDKDYREFIAWVKDNAEFIQFNHPYSWKAESGRNKQVGNFGRALYSSDVAFVAAADLVVRTFSVISTVKGGHISGQHKHSTAKTYREIHTEHYKLYKEHLNLGFRISPAANQDTHWTNWGTVTAARTAVWADSASYEDLMKAFKANRVYATEDDEMAVAVQVEYKGQRYWMGETVPLDAEEDDVVLIVKVWQGPGSDNDPIDEGPYTITIFSDPDGIGGHEAAAWGTPHPGVLANVEKRIPLHVASGQYLYVQVTEEGGKDNPIGDGEDEINNDTGQPGADGKRDVLNDSAWTTPIWFTSAQAGPKFIWSKNSNVYHDAICWVVPSIGQANRREGNSPPAGKTKHDCKPAN